MGQTIIPGPLLYQPNRSRQNVQCLEEEVKMTDTFEYRFEIPPTPN